MADSDEFRIDAHKLHLHPQRVADWLAGKNIAPVYMEVSPSGACNHRCRFCGLDFRGYQPRFLPADEFVKRLKEMGRVGVKSVMYAGEGEPFMHRDMARLAEATREAGIDTAFTTNAVLLGPDVSRRVLPVASWIKVSCNAGKADTYAHIHGTQAGDFEKVMRNIGEALRLRSVLNSKCTIGVQMVLLPENRAEACALARRVRESGADYLVIKPYSVHRQSGKVEYKNIRYGDCRELEERLNGLATDDFKVVFRSAAIKRRDTPHMNYQRCLSFPFWGYLDSQGKVWGCLRHIGEENFFYGNIFQESVGEVLCGEQRLQKMLWCSQNMDIAECHVDCRMDIINGYLWELSHPGPHANFI